MRGNKAIVGILLIFSMFCIGAANEDKKFDENLYILEALMAVDNSKHEDAVGIYKELFKKTNKTTYLKEALKFAFVSNSSDFNEILKLAEQNLKDDPDFLRIKGAKLMGQNRLEEARRVLENLIKKEPRPRSYIMLGSLFSMQRKNEEALAQFQKAYEIEKSDENLIRIADFLYNKMNRKQEAVSYLETSRRINGCTAHVCMTLIDFYIQMQQFNNTIEIYENLYEIMKEKEFLNKALGIYVYQKNYEDAIKFLKKHKHNDDALMEIYAMIGDFDGAYNKAKEIFDKSFNLEYQAKMAIYQYERDSKKMTKKSLDEIIYNFEKSVNRLDNPVYFNYYGYLLIDHDVDIKRGVELVKKALERDPNSVYYIDSLAWGYFKLGECEKADELMQGVMHDSEFIDSDEAKEHIRMIKECLQKNKK